MENQYALLIIPPPEIKIILEKIILQLSDKYKGPKFETHLTLLGRIDSDEKTIIEKTKELAQQIKPFFLTLGEISFSNTYFQSVFVRIKSTAELMDANLKAKEKFHMDYCIFMPHISLLYGNHSMKLREKITSEIELPQNLYFTVDKIIVTPDTNNPADWKHLAEINLG